MSQTNDKAFESYVETILSRSGWQSGDRVEWDVERALFPARIFAFLQDTQPKLWEEMRKLHDAGLENLLISTLVKELDVKALSISCATASSSMGRRSGWPISSRPTG